ncbi:phosphotransferase enzyme family protein [Deinococcus aquaedulcis]|uniref:phosphotransferase enzyme family protein n=1 Tax=Deinococcus aquaedulcis TaxID=2840455 RepID=UPI001C83DDF2|nr:phosphotransferase [Deinococcus aquaedulcis]
MSRLLLEEYGLRQAHITLLREGENSVFRVDIPSGERYALRLHTAGRHHPAALDSELEWLDLLARNGAIPVPQPVRSVSGSWVASLRVPPAPSLLCTLLTWLEGEALPEGQEFTLTQAEQAGEVLGQLHTQAEQFRPPAVFERPHYDAPYFLASARQLQQNITTFVDRQRLDRLNVALPQMLRKLGPLNDIPGGFGLIHADVHPGNFLQQETGLALIDFDRCGWGPFLLDLANADLALEPEERAALITGYTRFRALPAGYEHPLKALRVLAMIDNLAFLSERPEELPFVLEALPVVETALVAAAGSS